MERNFDSKSKRFTNPRDWLRTVALLALAASTCGRDAKHETTESTSGALTTAVTATFQDGASGYAGTTDTQISQNAPTTNSGSAASINADGDEPTGGGKDVAALFRWDISSIPAGSTIQSASITFRVTNTTTNTYPVFALARSWSESSATWNQSATGAPWQTPGAIGANDRRTTNLGSLTAPPVGSYTVTLGTAGIAQVQQWVANPSQNFGIIVASTSNTDGVDVASSENTTVANRPRLTVTYMPPSPPDAGADVPVGSGGSASGGNGTGGASTGGAGTGGASTGGAGTGGASTGGAGTGGAGAGGAGGDGGDGGGTAAGGAGTGGSTTADAGADAAVSCCGDGGTDSQGDAGDIGTGGAASGGGGTGGVGTGGVGTGGSGSGGGGSGGSGTGGSETGGSGSGGSGSGGSGSGGAPGPSVVLYAAADIGDAATTFDNATGLLLDGSTDPIALLGDIAYPSGSSSNFTKNFVPAWGRHKSRFKPSPGNHEYQTSNASGYFGYFGATAGSSSTGYYSYNLGAWHIIALNSGRCSSSPSTCISAAQLQWLRNDLAANPRACTLAYWHHPRFSSGEHGQDASRNSVAPLWDVLMEHGADVVLNGHDHDYERWAPQNTAGEALPTGIAEFVIGTGGTSLRPLSFTPPATSVANNTTDHGILKLTLRDASYDWQFIPVAGKTFADSGSANCH